MESLYTPNSIRTFSGIYVNILDPKPDMFVIEDIAHSLAFQCRFGGHLPTFYSVAQHSFAAANAVSHEHKLAALLHDASEAYLLDIPSPFKAHLANYKELEDRIMKIIAEKFGFQYPLSAAVKEIDHLMLEFEWHRIMLQKVTSVKCFNPSEAKSEFLKTYHEIVKFDQDKKFLKNITDNTTSF